MVIFLALMLVSNEFIAEKYRSRTLVWTMFAACGTMYLNFLIPHVVHSIKPVWFYLSCIVSLMVVFAIHGFAYAKQRESMTVRVKNYNISMSYNR